MTTYLKYFCLIAALAAVWGCSRKEEPKPKPSPPAKVQNAVRETDLTTITLTAEAESRLGIETTAVEHRLVEKRRTFGGEVVPVSGRLAVVSAPMSGTLLSPQDGPALTAGEQVTQGQVLCRLSLTLPEKDLLSVQEDVSLRTIERDLAAEKLKRARQLLEDKAGSVKQLEEAQAQWAAASAALKTSEARLNLLRKGPLDSDADGITSLTIKSPIAGVVQEVYAVPGQTVTGSTPLLKIVGIDPVWMKVPVYVGDLAGIDYEKPARVHSLSDLAGAEAQTAEPVTAPFSADPNSITADLFYALSNTNLAYRPGQRVAVTLALKSSQRSLVVPYSSILYDMYGGAWVYQNVGPHVYVRQRVELHFVVAGVAVLSRGPAVRTKVVSAGAAELFGTEFGVGK